jgi:hypothetical protein
VAGNRRQRETEEILNTYNLLSSEEPIKDDDTHETHTKIEDAKGY